MPMRRHYSDWADATEMPRFWRALASSAIWEGHLSRSGPPRQETFSLAASRGVTVELIVDGRAVLTLIGTREPLNSDEDLRGPASDNDGREALPREQGVQA